MALEAPPPEILPVAAPSGRISSTAISVALLVVSVTFAVSGQLLLKSGMDRVGRIGSAQVSAARETISRVIRQPRIWFGLGLFGISALFWLVVLSRVDLSLAYPFVGLSYIVIVVLSRVLLDEHVPALRWVGVTVVALGIALVGISSRTISN